MGHCFRGVVGDWIGKGNCLPKAWYWCWCWFLFFCSRKAGMKMGWGCEKKEMWMTFRCSREGKKRQRQVWTHGRDLRPHARIGNYFLWAALWSDERHLILSFCTLIEKEANLRRLVKDVADRCPKEWKRKKNMDLFILQACGWFCYNK